MGDMVTDESLLDPYSPGSLEELSDDQLLDLRHNVAAILADRTERCRRLLAKVEPKKRTRKAKADK